MATPGRQNLPNNPPTISSIKHYYIPLLLLATSVFFQLVVLPRSFPPSHYDVLGIPKYSSVEEVTQAYEKITSRWNSSVTVPPEVDLVKVQYAYELLTNQLLKRDYDIFSIDEYIDVVDKVNEQHSGKHLSEIDLPLIEAASFDPVDQDLEVIKSENFSSIFEDDKPLLLQIISTVSKRSLEFSATWKRIVSLLDGVANTAVVELSDVKLAAYLAEKKSSGQPLFRNGLPTILGFPPGCKSSSCLYRYEDELSVDAVTNWLATSILNLPRIPYHSKESLVQNFLVKSKPHQVKVILISKTGERATPFIRQATRTYSPYATFAFAMWRQEESAFWWNMFGVESAPAIVFVKDPGVEPVVHEGHINSSTFIDLMEKNKYHVLPQLRSLTSMELGCDVNGHSRAGKDTKIWYCALVAGRPSPELSKMRQTMRKVQDKLTDTTGTVDQEPASAPAASALEQKRLTFAWLDGEAQNKYCFFNLHSEDSFETCGPRRSMVDAARLFIVRYERFPRDEKLDAKKQEHILHSWYQTESDPVSTLVAKYNGTSETSEIISWISRIISDGDSREIPPFRTKAPELVPEEADQSWTQNTKRLVPSGGNIKHLASSFKSRFTDHLGDPRIGPSLLLLALMSSGYIWLNKNRSAQTQTQTQSNDSQNECDQTKEEEKRKQEEEKRRRMRGKRGSVSNQLIPPSTTDFDPKNAEQVAFSDSDSE
ncbi:uncharacterized protein LOC121787330 [Salvia splendens]|uniref:uncharacterized protein LOC121787330 n=1 Tax=Salvia splendens TaxID=180675 RepID=UPI001C27235E|nr:uncharacterized protein LOC121787330 [Salvia splendens]